MGTIMIRRLQAPSRGVIATTSLLGVTVARAIFLMPTKERIGLVVLMFAFLGILLQGRWSARNVLSVLKISIPIILLTLYGWILAIVGYGSSDIRSFSVWMAIGIGCFAAVYFVSKEAYAGLHVRWVEKFGNLPLLLLLLLPGVIHLATYVLDISLALYHGRINGLEYIKEVPRVGRKHLSIALSELMLLSVFAALFGKPAHRKIFVSLTALSAIALATLDTRAAYFEILVVIVVVSVMRPLRAPVVNVISRLTRSPTLSLRFVIALFVISVAVALATGYGRWRHLPISLERVVAQTRGNLQETGDAWWNKNAWESGTNERLTWDSAKCKADKNINGCVDQSIYLRLSWIIFGLTKMWDAPQGIGASHDPLHDLVVKEVASKAQTGAVLAADFHSALMDLIICFGFPGLALVAWFFYKVLQPAYRLVDRDPQNTLLLAIMLSVALCLARFLVDGLNEGLWYYAMVLSGMLAGFVHAANLGITQAVDRPMRSLGERVVQ